MILSLLLALASVVPTTPYKSYTYKTGAIVYSQNGIIMSILPDRVFGLDLCVGIGPVDKMHSSIPCEYSIKPPVNPILLNLKEKAEKLKRSHIAGTEG